MANRGAQSTVHNHFERLSITKDWVEGIDDFEVASVQTQVFYDHPKSILSKNKSEDIPFDYSLNPYQGCEHGCIYCYARNSHEYWGWNAGIDFESKILVKEKAAVLLEQQFLSKHWKPSPIVLSGNTDCYQPLERKFGITREILKVCLKYRHPVGIITKNALILRDLDILEPLAALGLVHVAISINTLEEEVRQKLEPRTVTGRRKLAVVSELSAKKIPVRVMVAPIIPWINHTEIPRILELSAQAGALDAGYTVVRLNGAIASLFAEWLDKYYPDRAERVKNAIKEMHGGRLNDSHWKRRMKGEGMISDVIHQLFTINKAKYFSISTMPPYNMTHFRSQGQYSLFGS